MTGGAVSSSLMAAAGMAAGTADGHSGDMDSATAGAGRQGERSRPAVPALQPANEAALAPGSGNAAAPETRSAGGRKRRRPADAFATAGASADEAGHAAGAAPQASIETGMHDQAAATAASREGQTSLPAAAQRRPCSEAGAAGRPAKQQRLAAAPDADALPAIADATPGPRGPTRAPVGSKPEPDWQRLYASGNGWAAPQFRQWRLPPQQQVGTGRVPHATATTVLAVFGPLNHPLQCRHGRVACFCAVVQTLNLILPHMCSPGMLTAEVPYIQRRSMTCDQSSITSLSRGRMSSCRRWRWRPQRLRGCPLLRRRTCCSWHRPAAWTPSTQVCSIVRRPGHSTASC